MQILTIMMIVLLLLTSLYYSVHSFTIYDARLTGGSSGTVQVLTYFGWQQMCLYSPWSYYDIRFSRVMCRQLGYDVNDTFSYQSTSYNSSSTSLVFKVYCSGSESKISECRNSFYGEQTSCSYVINVTCIPCTDGSVQLRGGVVPEAGTVEYCVDEIWNAVCDNSWDYRDAFVVCRQLGLPATGATRYRGSYFGVRSLPSGMYFQCFGNESSLSSCQNPNTTCSYANTAGVYCTGDEITELCTNGHVRLVGGRDTREGRVEVCSNGVWGTIYGGWDSRDATVVCRQLGVYQPYSRVEVYIGYSGQVYFGSGTVTGPSFYSNLNCIGSESTLAQCNSSNPLSQPTYSYSNIPGVRCSKVATTTRSDCSDGDVRLVNGTTPSEGRVEICYDRVWGSVCDFGWSYWDAAIVCLQLNYQGTNATALTRSYFGSGTGPYHLSNASCSGEERTLLECTHNSHHACGAGHDAGVRCDVSTCTHGDVRLFGGYTDHDGVAEVCINGFWADICADGVSTQTVRTFCRQFIGAEAAYAWSPSPSYQRQRNTGNITLYGITCSGQSGSFIQDCTYSTVSGSSSGGCSLQEELIVGCYEQSNCTNGDIRFRGGSSTFEGRVEICSRGQWGAIAARRYYYSDWNYVEASVVCRQLGYHWEWAIGLRNLGRNNTRNVIRWVHCSGTERSLLDCSHSSITSGLSYERHPSAGVICQGNTSAPTQCEHGEVRLVGGQKKMEGRVEICANGYWATACYNSWNIWGTEIVCKQLGFPSDGSRYTSDSSFGPNYDLPIVSVSCGSGYTNISQCSIYTHSSSCNHRSEVGIICQEREQYYSVNIIYEKQQSYELQSSVKFNCTVNHPNVTYYEWSLLTASNYFGTYSVRSRDGITTRSIPLNSLDSVDYYCEPFHNGRLLGRQRITLDIKGLLLRNVSGTNHAPNIQVRHQDMVRLQVELVNIDILKYLLNLTWYHNGSVIAARHNQRYMISNRNKTLTITNFTFADAGVYEARFNELFVHPFDEHCRDEVLSLLRHLPVLKPAVFCVNMEGSCPDKEGAARLRTISITAVQSALNGTLNSITLRAHGTVFTSKELKHAFIIWYRNGQPLSASSSTLQRHYTELSLSRELKLFGVSYEQSGRYEVLLQVNMYTYLQDPTCKPYYNSFISYLSWYRSVNQMFLARDHVDINYYKDLSFNVTTDRAAANRDEGATLTCRASIGFPPFSMVSFIKNGETVATSTSGQLQIDTKSVNANPFGLYICQLNASGATYNKTLILKDQALIMIKIDTRNTNICNEQGKSAIEDALVSKITSDCRCSFDHNDLRNSSIVCKGSELVYTATMEYSSEDGSETASVIAGRIVAQAPFAMTVAGMPVTVISACSDCQKVATLSPAAGGGLFFGGILTALVVIGIIIIVIMVIMKTKCNNMDQPGNQHAAQPDPISDSGGNLVRNPSYCVHRRMKVEASLQRQDYEEVEIVDQPVYEAAF